MKVYCFTKLVLNGLGVGRTKMVSFCCKACKKLCGMNIIFTKLGIFCGYKCAKQFLKDFKREETFSTSTSV